MQIKLITILLSITLSMNVYSQTTSVSPLDIVKPVVKPVELKPMTKETISILNSTLRTNNYAKLYEVMSALVKNDDYINFLLSMVDYGHPPVFWLMADYYSVKNNPQETHKWYYIAIIMTQQDSALCLDLSARFAAQKTIKAFPDVLTITRQTPQFTNQAMTEVIFFLKSLKQRAHPGWACSFGDNEHLYPKEKTINPQLWNYKRSETLKKFSNSFSQ